MRNVHPLLLVLLRHGESTGNAADRGAPVEDEFWDQSNHDWHLTAHGREQAAAAGRRLSSTGLADFDEQWVSPMLRARETAQHLGLPNERWVVHQALAERSWGHEQRGLRPEARSRWLAVTTGLLAQDPWHWAMAGGESLATVQARVRALLSPALISGAPARLLLVTHGELIVAAQAMFHPPFVPSDPQFRVASGSFVAYRRDEQGTWSRAVDGDNWQEVSAHIPVSELDDPAHSGRLG
jgi:broad specificity phosphatase PhoE